LLFASAMTPAPSGAARSGLKWRRGAIVAVIGLSAMAGVRESPVAAQAGNSPTVGVRRNPVFVGPVWPGDFNGDGVAGLAGRSEDPANPYDPSTSAAATASFDDVAIAR
jgi:hypothetical protein